MASTLKPSGDEEATSFDHSDSHYVVCEMCDQGCRARHHCDECLFNLCDACSRAHARLATRGHHVKSGTCQYDLDIELCPRDHQKMAFFCRQCCVRVCPQCEMESKLHLLHHVVPLAEQMGREKEKLLDRLDDVTSKTETVSYLPGDIQSVATQIELKWLERKELIRQEFASLYETITTRQNELLSDMDEAVKLSLKSLEELQQNHQTVLSGACQLSDDCISAVQKLPRDQFTKSYPQFLERIRRGLNSIGAMEADFIRAYRPSLNREGLIPSVAYLGLTHSCVDLSDKRRLRGRPHYLDKKSSAKELEKRVERMPGAEDCMPSFLRLPFSLHTEKVQLDSRLQFKAFQCDQVKARECNHFVPSCRLDEELMVSSLLEAPDPADLPPSCTLHYNVHIFSGTKTSKQEPVWTSGQPLQASDTVINGYKGYRLSDQSVYQVKFHPVLTCHSHQGQSTTPVRPVSVVIVTDERTTSSAGLEQALASGDTKTFFRDCNAALNSAMTEIEKLRPSPSYLDSRNCNIALNSAMTEIEKLRHHHPPLDTRNCIAALNSAKMEIEQLPHNPSSHDTLNCNIALNSAKTEIEKLRHHHPPHDTLNCNAALNSAKTEIEKLRHHHPPLDTLNTTNNNNHHVNTNCLQDKNSLLLKELRVIQLRLKEAVDKLAATRPQNGRPRSSSPAGGLAGPVVADTQEGNGSLTQGDQMQCQKRYLTDCSFETDWREFRLNELRLKEAVDKLAGTRPQNGRPRSSSPARGLACPVVADTGDGNGSLTQGDQMQCQKRYLTDCSFEEARFSDNGYVRFRLSFCKTPENGE